LKKPAQGKKLRGNRGMKKSGGGAKLGFRMYGCKLLQKGPLTKEQCAQFIAMGKAAGHDMDHWS
jgi:hypothetical protein